MRAILFTIITLILTLTLLENVQPAQSTGLKPKKMTREQECSDIHQQCSADVPCCGGSEFECKLDSVSNKETTCEITECKANNRLCHHPDECCSGYCQAVAVGTALCRTRY